jgi:outer membrane receptor protein involved in Fe transport
MEEPKDMDYIPLVSDFTLLSRLNLLFNSKLYRRKDVRYLDNRLANKDNSIVANAYTVTDLNTGYKWNNMNVEM